jgi:hypothetical protein
MLGDSCVINCAVLTYSYHVMYCQFNIQKFYVLLTQCVCVLCGSEDKQRLFPYTALTDWFLKRGEVCLLRGTD